MAKFYFYYSSMNAGKSTALLQSSYNYRERGMSTLVLAPDLDNRYGVGKVTSRIGLETNATTFRKDEDLLKLVSARDFALLPSRPGPPIDRKGLRVPLSSQ